MQILPDSFALQQLWKGYPGGETLKGEHLSFLNLSSTSLETWTLFAKSLL
jgi:hypothetical protein